MMLNFETCGTLTFGFPSSHEFVWTTQNPFWGPQFGDTQNLR